VVLRFAPYLLLFVLTFVVASSVATSFVLVASVRLT